MDTTLDEYIASNKALQEAIHCAKVQFSAFKRDTKTVPEDKASDNKESDDDDAIEIIVEDDEELREIWQGPSSKQAFLSLNPREGEQFDQMYEKLNNDLGKVALEDSNRPVLGVDISDNDRLPSIHSQQWRLRSPNIGTAHPPGMPPLVPVCLLNEKNNKNHTNNERSKNTFRRPNQFKNYNNRSFGKNRYNRNGGPFNKNNNGRRNSHYDNYFQRNNRNENRNNFGNTAKYASTSSLQSNVPSISASTENMVATALNASNIINFIPVGTVPLFINQSMANNNLGVTSFIDNGCINMNMNSLLYIGNQPVGLNVVAVSSNDGIFNNIYGLNNENEFSLGRDNLNGIRNYGGIRNQQNDQFLRRALNMTVNSVINNEEENKNNDNNDSVMNVGENLSLNITSTQLVKALKDLFKEGIQIKLAS